MNAKMVDLDSLVVLMFEILNSSSHGNVILAAKSYEYECECEMRSFRLAKCCSIYEPKKKPNIIFISCAHQNKQLIETSAVVCQFEQQN